jgi:thiamine biosynthesis lipoprotein
MPSGTTASRRTTESWPALGSLARVVVYAPDHRWLRPVQARVAALDRILSDYIPNSELNRVCREAHARTVRVSREFFTVLSFAQRVSLLSGGVFDVSIGARTRGRTGSVGYQYVALGNQSVRLAKPDMQFDFGGLAKGFIADEVSALLDRMKLHQHLVAFSGDIVVGDAPPNEAGWKIGLGSANQVRSVIRCGISTAGNTFQPGHILDATTSQPHSGEETLTVLAPNGLTADALDTALLLMQPASRHALLDSFPGATLVG